MKPPIIPRFSTLSLSHRWHYIKVSAKIYSIYLKYIAAQDIHGYSIDEVFIEATHYIHAFFSTFSRSGAVFVSRRPCRAIIKVLPF